MTGASDRVAGTRSASPECTASASLRLVPETFVIAAGLIGGPFGAPAPAAAAQVRAIPGMRRTCHAARRHRRRSIVLSAHSCPCAAARSALLGCSAGMIMGAFTPTLARLPTYEATANLAAELVRFCWSVAVLQQKRPNLVKTFGHLITGLQQNWTTIRRRD